VLEAQPSIAQDRDRRAAADARVRAIFAHASSVHLATAERSTSAMTAAADAMIAALVRRNKVLAFGNGGSAADSQHFAAELVGRFQRNRQALAAMALTTDTSIITSIANDFAYEQVFVRQLEAIGRPGDVAFGISTSGRSPNVLTALARAKEMKMTTIALIGPHHDAIADIVIPVAAETTARIQEAHRTALHAICELVEEQFAGA